MQRKGISSIVQVLRYNSPSKTQIKKLAGRPKYLKEPKVEIPAIDYSKLQYQTKEEAPFAVSRTYPGNNLPVYTDIRNGGSRHLVVVRRIEGDSNAMASELMKLFPTHKVEVHQGSIQISGNVKREVGEWLEKLGF